MQSARGKISNLVIPLRWSDHKDRDLPSLSEIGTLFNHDGYHELCPTGSVRDVFRQNSYGNLDIESIILPWIPMDNTETYYANGNRGLTIRIHGAVIWALEYVENNKLANIGDFDKDGDGLIDAITFLHSGYGSEWGGTSDDGAYYMNRIWSHKWGLYTDGQLFSRNGWTSRSGVKVVRYHISPAIWGLKGNEIGRIGVISHETGHFLGISDLYDGTIGMGLGSYDLMANSWGFDGSQFYPPLMSAWTKIELGWIVPTLLKKPGTYQIHASADTPQVYKIEDGYPQDEYLLIENRQKMDFDVALPRGGLAIYHIDDTAPYGDEGHPDQPNFPQSGAHYRVAMIQADGNFDLEKGLNRGDTGDLFFAGGIEELGPSTLNKPFPNTDAYQNGIVFKTGNIIHSISSSGNIMTFCFKECSPTSRPTNGPTSKPTTSPTGQPSRRPTVVRRVSPTLPPTYSPTQRPTEIPTKREIEVSTPTNPPNEIIRDPYIEYLTMKPTLYPSREGELITPKSGDGYYKMRGYMFDLISNYELIIRNLKIHTLHDETEKRFVYVYAKEGTFWTGRKEEDWILLGKIPTTGSGYGQFKLLPEGSLTPYTILPRKTYSFYIHCDECFVLATMGTAGYNKMYIRNREIMTRNGRGMLSKFGQSLRKSFNWSGAIQYMTVKGLQTNVVFQTDEEELPYELDDDFLY